VLGYAFMDAENFIPANPLVTPSHIQPEWYFLFAYAILRSIPNKLGGVVSLVLSIVVLFLLPLFSSSNVGGVVYSPFRRFFFWLFLGNFILLTWLGSCPAEPPFVQLSLFCSIFYFLILFTTFCPSI
jgi:ubiquinol-cytochrome c reductase cytochrome b subunit